EAGLPHVRRAVALAGEGENAPRLRLAELLLRLGQANEAEQHYRQLLEPGNDSPHVHLGLGRAACTKGDWQSSLPHLERAARHPATSKCAAALLATVYRRLGRPQDALVARVQEAAAPDSVLWFDPLADEMEKLSVARSTRQQRAIRLLKQGRTAEA